MGFPAQREMSPIHSTLSWSTGYAQISYWLVIRKNRCQKDAITCVYIPSYHALSYPHRILNLYSIHSPLSGCGKVEIFQLCRIIKKRVAHDVGKKTLTIYGSRQLGGKINATSVKNRMRCSGI